MSAAEEWRAVPGYEGRYEVSNLGRVRSWLKARGLGRREVPRVRKLYRHLGYDQINLCRDGVFETFKVYVLVAAAFIGPRPPGAHVDHVDGDKAHSALANLEYVTPKENVRRAKALGLVPVGEEHGQAKATEAQMRAALERYAAGGETLAEVARAAGVGGTTLWSAIEGRIWRGLVPPETLARCRAAAAKNRQRGLASGRAA